MKTNYKLLQYSWETDPKVKAWKDAFDKARKEHLVEHTTPFPTRVKVNGEWFYPSTVKPKPKPTTQVPPDPRSVEQFNNDFFLKQCSEWDCYPEKKHIRDIKERKASLRRDVRAIHKLQQSWDKVDVLGRGVEDLKEIARRSEYVLGANDPKYSIHLFEYIDYVNIRFGLNIRKDILTDKEFEKSKLIIDVAPVKTIGGVNGL